MITQEKLNTITAAVSTVESLATAATAATGVAPTNQQKLQAAISIATVADPSLQPVVSVLPSLIASLVNIFNSFGIFKKKAAIPSTPVTSGSASSPAVSN